MKKIRIFALIMLVVSSFLAYLQFNTKTTKKVYANEFDYYLKFFQEKGNEKAKMKLLSKNISSKDIIANSPKLSQKYTKTYGYLPENYWDNVIKIMPTGGATREEFLYDVYATQKAIDDKADLTVKKAPDLSSKEVSALEKYNKSEEDITENITLDNKENYERYRNGVLAFLKEMKINPFKTHGEKFEDRLVIDKTIEQLEKDRELNNGVISNEILNPVFLPTSKESFLRTTQRTFYTALNFTPDIITNITATFTGNKLE